MVKIDSEDKITIINSANLSTGVGLQVIEAAIMAQQGKSAAEIISHAGGVISSHCGPGTLGILFISK